MSGIQGAWHLAAALASELWEASQCGSLFASPHMSQLVLDPRSSRLACLSFALAARMVWLGVTAFLIGTHIHLLPRVALCVLLFSTLPH